jgi:DNA-binding CsgD family transcriptional regulator
MAADTELLRVVDAIYDAAVDPAAWEPALALLCEESGADHAITFAYDGAGNRLAAAARLEPVHLMRFAAAFGGPVDWFDTLPQTKAFDFQAVIPRREFVRTDFFNDIVGPAGGYRALCCIPLRSGKLTSYIALCRSQRGEDFGGDEAGFLDRIAPHFRRALRTRLRGDEHRWRAQAVLDAFDRWDLAMLVVDPDLGPVVQTRQATRIIERGDGLRLSRRRLLAGNAADMRRLQALVARAAADDPRAPGRYAMRLSRPAPSPPWIAVVTLLAPESATARRSPLVALILEDVDRRPADGAGLLASLFALTPREAQLAMALAAGRDLMAAADSLEIAYVTARGYLKSIFAKTATRRQAELVALIQRLDRFGG